MKVFIRLYLVLILLVTEIVVAQKMPKVKNVVVIIADDHALHVTRTYGNQLINTPNIDRLSDQGVTFTNAFCNAPICSASRQSLLTGKYPHATGVNLLFTPFPDAGNETVAEHLDDYACGLFGKTHFNNWMWYHLYEEGLPKHGFDVLVEGGDYRKFIQNQNIPPISSQIECYDRKTATEKGVAEWMNCRTLPHPVQDEYSQGTFYANQAIEYIKENKDNPFFVWLAFHQPHHPYYFPIEYKDKYDPEDMPLPGGSPEDDRWIPEKFKNLSDQEKRGIIASYYTSTEYMDKNVGLVLDALDDMQLSENTLVVYLSDNGYLLNDHKRFEKHTMWQQAVHQPMIFRFPNEYHAGQRSEAMVEYVDVIPTIVDLLGEKPMREAQGRSFKKTLEDVRLDHRDYVFSEYLEDNLAMVKTKEWKYVFTTGSRDLGIGYQTGHGPSGIVHRLYHMIEDPKEYTDVSKDPDYSDVLLTMQRLMLKHFIETHPNARNCPAELTLEGKLVWFCEPRDVGADPSLQAIPIRVF